MISRALGAGLLVLATASLPVAAAPGRQAALGKWRVVDAPGPGAAQSTGMTDVDMLSPDEGWAVGFVDYAAGPGVETYPAFWHYTGGAWRWVPLLDASPGCMWAIDMVSTDEGWAVGDATSCATRKARGASTTDCIRSRSAVMTSP